MIKTFNQLVSASLVFGTALSDGTFTTPGGESSIHMYYSADDGLVHFDASVKDNSYIALAFGACPGMTDCDTLVWQANGASSSVQEFKTFEMNPNNPPTPVANQAAYTSTTPVVDSNAGTVSFTSTRELDPSSVNADTYVLSLDTATTMRVAWEFSSYQMDYHSSSGTPSTWEVTLTDPTPDRPWPVPEAWTYETADGIAKSYVFYDTEAEKVTYQVELQDQHYFAIGYGACASMTNIDMLLLFADGAANSSGGEYFAASYGAPTILSDQTAYDIQFVYDETVDPKIVYFTATRDLDSTANAESVSFTLGQEQDACSAWHSWTSASGSIDQHEYNERDHYTFTLEGGAPEPPFPVPAQWTQEVESGAKIYVYYDSNDSKVHYNIEVPENSYFAMGYGDCAGMADMNLLIAIANGESSTLGEYYVDGYTTPGEIASSYTYTKTVDSVNGVVWFDATRDLDPVGAAAQTYVLSLGTETPVCSAWRTGVTEVVQHNPGDHVHYSFELRDNTMPPFDIPDTWTYSNTDGSANILVEYNDDDSLVYYKVKMTNDHWFSMGYGSCDSMIDTNMAVWFANGESSSQTENFAPGFGAPPEIANSYSTDTIQYDDVNGLVYFISTRELDPTDSQYDQTFPLTTNEDIAVCYAWRNGVAFEYHDGREKGLTLYLKAAPPAPFPIPETWSQESAGGSKIYIYYDETDQLVHYNVEVPNGNFFAIGYGVCAGMADCNEAIWYADGASSYQSEYYSEDFSGPVELASNSYTMVEFVYNDVDDLVWFHSTRELDPVDTNDGKTFVLELNKVQPMVDAWAACTTLCQHGGGDHETWSLYLTYAKPEMPFDMPKAWSFEAPDIETGVTGGKIYIYYDDDDELVHYNVQVPNGSWLGIGYGECTGMADCNIAIWYADSQNSHQNEYYSVTMEPPTEIENTYTTDNPVYDQQEDLVWFVSTRQLDPTNATPDKTFVIQLDVEQPMVAAWKKGTVLDYHDGHDTFTIELLTRPDPPFVIPDEWTYDNGEGYKIDMFYESQDNLVHYNVQIPDQSYFAIAYGNCVGMVDCNIAIWFADTDQSSQGEYYSTEMGEPTELTPNSYSTEFVYNKKDGLVWFATTRWLDPKDSHDGKTFVIELDKIYPMRAVWYPSPTLVYHEDNKGSFNFVTPPAPEDTWDFIADNGARFHMYWDAQLEKVKYKVQVPTHSYLAIGYGSCSGMEDMNIVAWTADTDQSWTQTEQYSETKGQPDVLPGNVYSTTVLESSSGYVLMESERDLDPASSNPQTYVLQLDVVTDICLVWQDTPSVTYHGQNKGYAKIVLSEKQPEVINPIEGIYPEVHVDNGSQLIQQVNEDDDTVTFTVQVKDQSYLAVGFGTQMADTNILIWLADGAENSEMTSNWSTGHTAPQPIENLWKWSHVYDETTGFVNFTSTRPLDPSVTPSPTIARKLQDSKDFVITPDQPTPMIWAYHDGTNQIDYHGKEGHGSYETSFVKVPKALDKQYTFYGPNGSQVTMWYNKQTGRITFFASIVDKSYFALGYGYGMKDTDMVFWSADGAFSEQKRLYSTGEVTPQELENYYTTTYVWDEANKRVNFTTYRDLDPSVEKAYVIELDKTQEISWAWLDQPALAYHGKNNRGQVFMKFTEQGAQELFGILYDWQILHGWIMFSAWTVLSLIMVVSNRYMKHYWRLNQWIHTFTGLLIFGFTIWGALITILKLQAIKVSLHTLTGFIMSCLGVVLCLGGAVVLANRTAQKDWDTKSVMMGRKVHKYFAWIVIFGSQLAVATGILRKLNDNPGYGEILLASNITGFLLVLLVGELNYQRILGQQISFNKVQKRMNREEVDEAVAEGQILLILDDMVLDASKYLLSHPGGKFVLKYNKGRDISKFFYGGYAMEGNIGGLPPPGNNHSNYARLVVNDLIIAQFDSGDGPPQSTIVRIQP